MESSKKIKSFLKNYCNYESLKNLIISSDIDWAPDFMIEDFLNLTQKINLTLFNTHKSKLLEQTNETRITIGIHPNLQLKSSQGKNIMQIKNFVKKIGDIKFLRFHILLHSYPDLKFFSKHGARIDSSILLMNQPYLFPNFHKDINLVRVPYIWEDGMALNFKNNIKKSLNLKIPGMKILNFHPIDIYLNTCNINHRSKFKNSFSSVLEATKKNCEKFINKKNYGIRNFLIDILNIIKNKKLKTTNFKELNSLFRECL